MCCICQFLMCTCSRLPVYLLQLAMITVACFCLVQPAEWNYVLLFKNSTLVGQAFDRALVGAQESIKEKIKEKIGFGTQGNGSSTSTTILPPLINNSQAIFWCALLIGHNLLGLVSLLLDILVLIVVYTLTVALYFRYSLFRYLENMHTNYLYLIDLLVFGLIGINCAFVIVYGCTRMVCCGCTEAGDEEAKMEKLAAGKKKKMVRLSSEEQHDPRLYPLRSRTQLGSPKMMALLAVVALVYYH